MPLRTRLSGLARRLVRDRSGNFGMMAAIICPMLVLGAGYGINLAQITTTRSHLLAALDAAVTSTARDLTTGVIAEDRARPSVEAFLFANGERVFAEPGRLRLDNLVIDKRAKTVTARASVVLDVAFPLFGAANRQTITTESAALYSDRKIEIAMMLDVTGSMSGQRLRDLKAAAANAVDTMLGANRPGNPRVRVALVPYANAVNTGSLAHIVHVERNSATPSEPPAFNWTIPAGTSTAPDRCATEREGSRQFSDVGPSTAMVNRDYRLHFCPSAAMMPLTADAASLKARIKGFVASGHTAGPVGIQWSWYMLSPRWAEVLPADAAPAAYGRDQTAKYAILMTDGEFNTAYAGVAGDREVRSQAGKARTHAERLCDEMKHSGIEVFTIGFQLREANAKATMNDCASPDTGSVQHYFETSSGAELDAAFQAIARNIERLALTR